MASNRSNLITLAMLLALFQFCSAAQFNVGDSNGWTFQGNYDQWAADKTFRVSDTLSFSYVGNHDVLEVSKADYDNCDASKPIKTYQTASPIQVTLSREGEHWFICGVSGHCSGGMKVGINVLAANSSPSPSGGAPSPASPARPSGGAPSPTTDNAPPPRESSAVSVLPFAGAVAAAAAGFIMLAV